CRGQVFVPTWSLVNGMERLEASRHLSSIRFDTDVSGIQNIKLYSYNDLQIATDDFSKANKIGEGGFGSVYKGVLDDGSLVAIKMLSAESTQGLREFLTEITVITDIEHENLVKLYGCCVERDQRILVYGYLENNSLAQTLLGGRSNSIPFSWKTRTKICIGIARGLAFLHEEVHPRIIHRDIKASNILLDKDLTPKISDFGLAKLFPASMTHISTRVAGTLGYLAPEYAMRGQVTRKADIYSFGVLLLEIICGRSSTNKRLAIRERYLLDRVWESYERGKLEELVDASLEGDFDIDEACRYLKVGLLCTQDVPKVRPSMSTVVEMLTGAMDVDGRDITEPSLMAELIGVKGKKKSMSTFTSSTVSTKQDSPSSSKDATMTYAAMTFTSISDR
ncbi:hypothetical protein RJ639_007994, partial [Escallonia herrerae]